MIRVTDMAYSVTNVNYLKMSQEIDAAVLRVGQGPTIIDNMFSTHVLGCDQAKVPWLTYFFSDYRYSAYSQALRYINLVNGRWGRTKYPAWMDLEFEDYAPLNWPRPSGYRMYLWGCQFITTFEGAARNIEIGSYMNLDMINQLRPYLKSGDPFMRHPLWLADWTTLAYLKFAPWPKWTLWQEAGDVKADWTSSAVDYDYFNGTLEDLLGQAPSPIPVPTPIPTPVPLYHASIWVDLNVRSSPVYYPSNPNVNYLYTLLLKDKPDLSIYEKKNGWGRIKPDTQEWVNLYYTTSK
jgi:GH25 family lysozyme M1 (1,4-beta-N-acetylmuramidase)